MDDFYPEPNDIVNEIFASNPGHIRVQWTHYFRVFPRGFLGFGTSFTVLIWLTYTKSLWRVFPLLPLLALDWLILRCTQTQFQSDDTNPGLILSQEPPLVAVFTDLSQGFGEYPVVKIIEQPLRACGLGQDPTGGLALRCAHST
jgi:hypothetical protein